MTTTISQSPGASRPNDGTPGIALWQQLQAVAHVIVAIREGQSATVALAAIAGNLRPGVQALVFHVLRRLGQAEALRRKLANRTPPPLVDALLCSALALSDGSDEALAEGGRTNLYDAFTLVDQAVEAAKRMPETRAQAKFVNACLRRFLREHDILLGEIQGEPLATWNHPRWWIERLRHDYPQQWQDILRANNSHAPMVLRVNTQQQSVADYLQQLASLHIKAHPIGSFGVRLETALPVNQIPGFQTGAVSVQDEGAQWAAPLLLSGLDTQKPLRILDACAAPGGKTAHLLELLGKASPAHVTALEVDATRCERIHETLARLNLQKNVDVLVADANDTQQWWPQHCQSQLFDAILLDAPCTASGIVRRHPDVRWLRRESDIAQLAIIQAGLLSALWPLLKPGGRLLYCTCSVFKSEGDAQISAFLRHNPDVCKLASPGHSLPQNGTRLQHPTEDHDGFFYALLKKRAH